MSLSTETFYAVYARKRDMGDGSDLPYALDLLEKIHASIRKKTMEIPQSPAELATWIQTQGYRSMLPMIRAGVAITNMFPVLDHRIETETPLTPQERANLDTLIETTLPPIVSQFGLSVGGRRHRRKTRRHARKTRKHSRR